MARHADVPRVLESEFAKGADRHVAEAQHHRDGRFDRKSMCPPAPRCRVPAPVGKYSGVVRPSRTRGCGRAPYSGTADRPPARANVPTCRQAA